MPRYSPRKSPCRIRAFQTTCFPCVVEGDGGFGSSANGLVEVTNSLVEVRCSQFQAYPRLVIRGDGELWAKADGLVEVTNSLAVVLLLELIRVRPFLWKAMASVGTFAGSSCARAPKGPATTPAPRSNDVAHSLEFALHAAQLDFQSTICSFQPARSAGLAESSTVKPAAAFACTSRFDLINDLLGGGGKPELPRHTFGHARRIVVREDEPRIPKTHWSEKTGLLHLFEASATNRCSSRPV